MKTSRKRRALRRVGLWSAAIMLVGGAVRAEASAEPAPSSIWIAVEGGWAHPLLNVAPYTPGDAYVGSTVPFRLDLGLRLSDHLWASPFVSLAKVQGVSTSGPAQDGFRMLLGGELQLHSAVQDDTFDYFGGLGVAFERLVAHSVFGGCGHCSPDSVSLIGNGVNLGFRLGVLVRLARILRIGPYVGAQLSWLPGLAPVRVSPADPSTGNPGGTLKDDISPVQLWFDVGLRVVFLL